MAGVRIDRAALGPTTSPTGCGATLRADAAFHAPAGVRRRGPGALRQTLDGARRGHGPGPGGGARGLGAAARRHPGRVADRGRVPPGDGRGDDGRRRHVRGATRGAGQRSSTGAGRAGAAASTTRGGWPTGCTPCSSGARACACPTTGSPVGRGAGRAGSPTCAGGRRRASADSGRASAGVTVRPDLARGNRTAIAYPLPRDARRSPAPRRAAARRAGGASRASSVPRAGRRRDPAPRRRPTRRRRRPSTHPTPRPPADVATLVPAACDHVRTWARQAVPRCACCSAFRCWPPHRAGLGSAVADGWPRYRPGPTAHVRRRGPPSRRVT